MVNAHVSFGNQCEYQSDILNIVGEISFQKHFKDFCGWLATLGILDVHFSETMYLLYAH